KTEQDRCLFTSLNYSLRRSLQTFGRVSGGLPSPTFSTTLSRVRSLIETCEMMVNRGKACLASESFLGLDMTIPTEPIGASRARKRSLRPSNNTNEEAYLGKSSNRLVAKRFERPLRNSKPPDHRLSLTASRQNPVSPLIRSTVYPT